MNKQSPNSQTEYKYKSGLATSLIPLSTHMKSPNIRNETEIRSKIYNNIATPATAANRPPETRFATPALVVGTDAAEVVLEALVLAALVLDWVVDEAVEVELALELEVVKVVGVEEEEEEVEVLVELVELVEVVETVVWVEVAEVEVLEAEVVVVATTAPDTVKRGEKL
jgi:hypothetical protein